MIKSITLEQNPFHSIHKRFKELFFIGDLSLLKKRKVAIVGTRRPNSYTKGLTHQIAAGLSNRDIVIVSGAAMGVDAIAHQGCKEFKTIAVVANGLDIHYPATNKQLIQQIEQKGLMLSAFEKGVEARNYHFVQRNELVVAMSEALIITQADLNSGSLTSAQFALKHNIPIYVLPHRLNESLGTQSLLKDGKASVIYDIESFLNSFETLQGQNDEILDYLKKNPNYEEALNKYGDILLEYEVEGRIKIANGVIIVL